MREFKRNTTNGKCNPKPCDYCRREFTPTHGLSKYCSGKCKADAIAKYKRDSYAAGFRYRKGPNARYYPKKCSNCKDKFTPTSGRDHLCSRCKQQRQRWKEDVVSALLRSCRLRFKTPCNLTRSWFERAWNVQTGLCKISGVPMSRERNEGAGNIYGKDGTKVSIDRINSDKPYTQDNCRLVCVMANLMRHRLSDKELFEWCRRILTYNHQIQ